MVRVAAIGSGAPPVTGADQALAAAALALAGAFDAGATLWCLAPSAPHLARHLAGALAPRHVLVNAIAPGLFPTRMSAFLDHEALRDPILSTIPLRRPGRPEEIAGAALLLASRAGAYTTGQVLVVDGGREGIGRADPVAGL